MAKKQRDRHPEPTPNFAHFPLTSLDARPDSFPSLAYQGERQLSLSSARLSLPDWLIAPLTRY